MYTLALRARSACGRKGLSTTVEEMVGEGDTLTVSRPMPALPPVTIMTLPERSGMSEVLHLGFGGMWVRFART